MKIILYSIAVTCFFTAGAMDIIAGYWREGLAAILLGLVNALIFLCR